MSKATTGGKGPRLDEYQAAAVAVRSNAVVAAGAGSGKTTVLARRFFELIRDQGAEVSRILTLTFTRKAAAEMHERIYASLLSEREHPRIARAVDDFDRAQISTLDSFCLQIARERPGLFGISRDFGIDDRATEDEAREQAIRFVESYAGNETLREFVKTNGFSDVLEGFFESLAARYLTIAEERDFPASFDRQLEAVAERLEEECAGMERLARACMAIPAATEAMERNQAALEPFTTLGELMTNRDYDAVLELLENNKPSGGRAGKRPELVEFKERADELRDARERALPLVDMLVDRDLVAGIARMCADYQDAVLEARRDSGVCSYDDIVRMAVAILTRDLKIRRFYQGKFDYIMIDEFQDNNDLQRDLLFLLAQRPDSQNTGVPDAGDLVPTKLFFVGDQKQSIYRFRGADVSVFKSLSRELVEAGGKAIELKTNYRSAPGLIEFFNSLFSRVMEDSAAPFEAEFDPLEPRQALEGERAEITVLYKPYAEEPVPDTAHSDDAEAYAVAKIISGIVGIEEIPDPATGMRKISYDDIAILMRSTSNQIRFERALRNNGIPYVVDSARSLFIESIINDIYALLQIIVYPSDAFAYTAVLRSPLVGVSDNALGRLMLAFEGAFDHSEDTVELLDPADGERYRSGRSLYLDMTRIAESGSLVEVVSRLWYEFGYRFQVLSRSEYHGYLDHFDYLRSIASDADSRGQALPELLDFLRENMGQYKRLSDIEVLSRGESGVRIMTVHKSKGLEFPVVFFANTGNRGGSRESSAPYYISDEYGLTVNIKRSGRKNVFYLQAKDENDAKDLAELKRLAYVACTRAKIRLYISGCHNRQNRTMEAVHLNMILKALGWDGASPVEECEAVAPYLRIIDDIPERALYIPGVRQTHRSRAEAFDAYHAAARIVYPSPERREWAATDVGAWMREFHPDLFARSRATESLEEAPPDPELDSLLRRKGDEALFGVLCHAMLAALVTQSAAGGGSTVGEELPGRKFEADVRTALSRFEDELQDRVREKAEELVSRVFTDAVAPLIEEGGIGVEIAFTHQITPTVRVRGQIDCLVEGESEIVLLDYKTDRVSDTHEHRYQIELYRAAASTWYDLPVRGILVYIRHNKVVELPSSSDLVYPWSV